MCQYIIKASCECQYIQQSAEQILISMMVNSCNEENMIKYLADNAETVAQIKHLHEFDNLIKTQDCKFTASSVYPTSKPAPFKIKQKHVIRHTGKPT